MDNDSVVKKPVEDENYKKLLGSRKSAHIVKKLGEVEHG